MDDGRGRFAPLDETVVKQFEEAVHGDKEKLPIFRVGETLDVRGSKLEIRSIDGFTGIITMRLLSRNVQ